MLIFTIIFTYFLFSIYNSIIHENEQMDGCFNSNCVMDTIDIIEKKVYVILLKIQN
jgi:hypothetical protein